MVTKARPDEPPLSLCSLPTAVSCVRGNGRVRGLLVFPRMPNVQTFGVRTKTAWCATTLIVPEQRPKSTSDQHPGRPSYCTSCIPPCLPPRLGGQAHGADDSMSLASTPPLRLPGFFPTTTATCARRSLRIRAGLALVSPMPTYSTRWTTFRTPPASRDDDQPHVRPNSLRCTAEGLAA